MRYEIKQSIPMYFIAIAIIFMFFCIYASPAVFGGEYIAKVKSREELKVVVDKRTYEAFIKPLDKMIARLQEEYEDYPDAYRLTEAIGSLMFARQSLIKQYNLGSYCHNH